MRIRTLCNWNGTKMGVFRWIRNFVGGRGQEDQQSLFEDHIICKSKGKKWKGYHANINQEQAESLLKDEKNVMFLVYDDPNKEQQLRLAVHYRDEVHHVRIRRRATDRKYMLGEETRAYNSVHRLIKRHRRPFGWAAHLQGVGRVTFRGYVYTVTEPVVAVHVDRQGQLTPRHWETEL